MSTKPYIFTHESSLENDRTDLVHTSAMAAHAAEFAKVHADHKEMIVRVGRVRAEELALWDEIITQQANVNAIDSSLDRVVDRVDLTLLAITERNRSAPLYRTYFANQRPSDAKKYVLAQELEMVRGWLPLLQGSEYPQLKELYQPAKEVVDRADSATAALATAENAAREFRYAGNRKKLIDDCNALRARAFGEIEEYVHAHPELNLPSDYASDFFRRGRRSTKPTLALLDEQITALETEVAALRDQRSVIAAQEEATHRVRAEADRKLAQAEIDRAQAEATAALRRVEELKSRVNR